MFLRAAAVAESTSSDHHFRMFNSQLPAISQSNPLSEEASDLFCRIPQLLRHLHDLEDEEARLNAQARQLLEPQLSTTEDRPPTSVVSTPVTKHRFQVPARGTTPHVGPNIYPSLDSLNEVLNALGRKH